MSAARIAANLRETFGVSAISDINVEIPHWVYQRRLAQRVRRVGWFQVPRFAEIKGELQASGVVIVTDALFISKSVPSDWCSSVLFETYLLERR